MTQPRLIEMDTEVQTQTIAPPPTTPTPIGRVEVGQRLFVAGATRVVTSREERRGVVTLVCDPMFVVEYRRDTEVQLLAADAPDANEARFGVHAQLLEKMADQPSLRDVSDQMVATVIAEDRRDVEVPLGDCRLDSLGRLEREATDEPLVLLDAAYRGVADRAPKSAASSLNLQEWLPESGASVVLRTLHRTDKQGPERCAFAVVSRRYQATDMHVMADVLASALPAETRGTWTYGGDGGRWSLRADLARPWSIPVGEGREEAHRASLLLSGHDNGRGGVSIRFRVERLRCSNGMVARVGQVSRSIRHLGDPNRMAQEIAEALGCVDEAMELYSARWAAAYGTLFRGAVSVAEDRYDVHEIDGLEALRRLVVARIVPGNGRRMRSWWGGLVDAYEAEPGDSVAHVVNAYTRFAHEGALEEDGRWSPSQWVQEDLEDAAGEIMQRAHVVLQPVDRDEYGWMYE